MGLLEGLKSSLLNFKLVVVSIIHKCLHYLKITRTILKIVFLNSFLSSIIDFLYFFLIFFCTVYNDGERLKKKK